MTTQIEKQEAFIKGFEELVEAYGGTPLEVLGLLEVLKFSVLEYGKEASENDS